MSPSRRAAVSRFIARLDVTARARLDSIAGADELLARALAEPARDWPSLLVDEGGFFDYLAARLPTEGLERSLANWNTSDLYLCYGCLRGDRAALETFEREHTPVIVAALRRLQLDDALIDDTLSLLRQRLLVATSAEQPPALSRYSGLGRLAGWLRIVATREARMLLRREHRYLLGSDERLAERLADEQQEQTAVQLGLEKRTYRQAFKRAFKRAMTGLSPAQATLLKQRYVDELGLAQLGKLHRVHHTTIHRRLEAARDQLLRAAYDGLMAELAIDAEQCQSIIRMIQSDFDLTLRTFFGTADAESGARAREGDAR